ncbi:(2Fe-2S) ferredoxin [Actinomycetospora sp. NBRC 106375]|uniref:aromatic ring-hydroxylating oxygenase subunit alpha n=1 Tax=Actinomycetospora sp. NBRC 106375 TaxID=3032207 RepID=UPI0024A47D7B|nr:aromatic ring-hydroxylating dioxygenase subunit alpha [Actinomycetospora sp. NBRC 106375]GLZ48815.1 (2Fe-2S) ferredoxin [Actinomycetospora sp. NBRC 106375]
MTTGEMAPAIVGSQLPASLRGTLSGRYYTDPTIFAAEQALIFETGWFCAVLAADIPSPGDFETVQIGRESVIVARGRDGAVRAHLNVCRHRGARICTEEKGSVRRAFQCPYHAWTYGLDGSLVSAPHLREMPDVDRADFGLQQVHLREWLGYVWLCLAEDPPSFEDTVIGDVTTRLGSPDAIVGYQVADLKLGRRVEYDVKANWKQIVENFMECYHCGTIHPELSEVLPEFADGLAAQYFVGHGAAFGEDVDGFTVDGSAGLERIPGVGDDQDRRYYAITVRPQVFVNLVPDHVVFHRMFPLTAERTLVRCDWLYLPGVVDSGADIDRSVELFHRVNQQDFDACERCQVSMDSRSYARGGVLVPSEHHIGDFHDWVLQKIG